MATQTALEAATSFIRGSEVQNFIAKLETHSAALDDHDRLGIHYDGALSCVQRLVAATGMLPVATIAQAMPLPVAAVDTAEADVEE